MRNIREVILFLNTIRFNNKKILSFIADGYLEKFLCINETKLWKLHFLSENEKILIKDNFKSFNIEMELHNLSRNNIKYSCIIDENYPKNLKNIANPPAIIYYKGTGFDKLNNILAIVGTRKPTPYGIWATKKIIGELRGYNISIASGMALGTDFKAHNEAISNDIHTIGVLASSLEYEYPRANKILYNKMQNNLLISEFPLGTPPLKRNFVQRNRIISGLSFGVLVIEAAEKSGSLITANFAIEQGREVYAIAGNINNIYSKGCNDLIKKGAKLIDSANDIIDEIEFISEVNKINTYQNLNYDSNTLNIINILNKNLLSIDEIVNKTNLDIQIVYSIIVKLEIDNVVENIGSKYTLY